MQVFGNSAVVDLYIDHLRRSWFGLHMFHLPRLSDCLLRVSFQIRGFRSPSNILFIVLAPMKAVASRSPERRRLLRGTGDLEYSVEPRLTIGVSGGILLTLLMDGTSFRRSKTRNDARRFSSVCPR